MLTVEGADQRDAPGDSAFRGRASRSHAPVSALADQKLLPDGNTPWVPRWLTLPPPPPSSPRSQPSFPPPPHPSLPLNPFMRPHRPSFLFILPSLPGPHFFIPRLSPHLSPFCPPRIHPHTCAYLTQVRLGILHPWPERTFVYSCFRVGELALINMTVLLNDYKSGSTSREAECSILLRIHVLYSTQWCRHITFPFELGGKPETFDAVFHTRKKLNE